MPLKTLCAQLKLDPREASKKLRSADAAKFPEIAKPHEPRRQWQWAKFFHALFQLSPKPSVSWH
jgi:hypothetical protein